MAGTAPLNNAFSKAAATFNPETVDADSLAQKLKNDSAASKYLAMNPGEAVAKDAEWSKTSYAADLTRYLLKKNPDLALEIPSKLTSGLSESEKKAWTLYAAE